MLPDTSIFDTLFASLPTGSTVPFFIKTCLFVSVGAMISIFIIAVCIPIIKYLEKQTGRRTAFAKNHISRLLLSAVALQAKVRETDLPESTMTVDMFNKSGISTAKVKRLLICEMFNYRNNFSGKVADDIRRLYIMLSLHKEAMHRLTSRNWKVKVQAMSELFQMDIEAGHEQLIKLLSNRNKYVRAHARLSLIKFTTHDPLQFLRDVTDPLSKWEEAEIYELLQSKTGYNYARIAELINEKTDHTVVALCLKLAAHFELTNTIPFITDLVRTPDIALRCEAVTALGKLHNSFTERHLTDIYYGQPRPVKLAILQAMGNMEIEHTLDFLEMEMVTSEDFEIKKIASGALVNRYPASKKMIDRTLSSGKPLIKKLLRHSLNPLINQNEALSKYVL